MSLFRIYSGAADLPVPCGPPGGADSAAAPLQECSLELWSHFSHLSLSAALPMADGIHPGNRQGSACPAPVLPVQVGWGGLCPCSGCPALLGCPGGEDTRVVQGAPGWPCTCLGERALLGFKASFWLGLVLVCCWFAADLLQEQGSCPGCAWLHMDYCCPSWTDSFPGPTWIHFSRKCCFWHLASPKPEFLSCLQAG